TLSPFRTLMAASWPATSGAMRISVVRTTPTMGGGACGRQRKYPPTPAATRITPSTTMRAGLRLGMRAPPLDEKRGNDRKHEVDRGQRPKATPIARHLPQARAQLIDAHQAVNGEIRREYVTRGKRGLGDRFARPGKTSQEELRKAGGEEDER